MVMWRCDEIIKFVLSKKALRESMDTNTANVADYETILIEKIRTLPPDKIL
jgi:hypothetical protein